MGLSIGMYSFECTDAQQLATFWSTIIGKLVDPGATDGYATLDREEEGPTWMFVKVPGPTTGENRFMLDLTHEHYEPEADRIVGAGATRVANHEDQGVRWTEFRDPENNTFRLFATPPE